MPTKYTDQKPTSLNANSLNSVTPRLDIKEKTGLAWSVLEKTGSHSTHVLTIQRSTDNINWDNTSSKITAGTPYQIKTATVNVRYVRVKVTTAEGSASTVEVVINAKQ